MPPLKVTCQHCQRVVTVDSEKVPDTPVSYRCPSCQGKVVVDKRKLLAGGAPDAGATSAPAAAAVVADPPAAAAPDRIQEVALPPGEGIPPGLMVAEDAELGAALQRALEPFDCVLEVAADAGAARERMLLEPAPLLVWVARTVSKPPYAPLEPLTSLPSRERRQSFIVLVADNVKTLDGNLAFLYQVNLLLNRQHVAQAPGILYSALRYHQRLYRPYLAAVGE
jgi:hypothetical protein